MTNDFILHIDSGCIICGTELSYSDIYAEHTCLICRNKIKSNVSCENGHYVCDACHSLSGVDYIEKYCQETSIRDPIELATSIMMNPSLKMHGPEHHFLVPAVMLTFYYKIQDQPDLLEPKLKIAKERASKILGGFCGTHGNCGAAVGTGIFISVITESTPLAKKEWQLSNLITSNCLREVALSGGPRCCKRDTYLSILESLKFLKEHFKIDYAYTKNINCRFFHNNKQCIGTDCRFYAQNTHN